MGDFGERIENKRINTPSEDENNSIYSKYKKLKTEYGEFKNRVINNPISIHDVFKNLDDLFNLNKLSPIKNDKIEVENETNNKTIEENIIKNKSSNVENIKNNIQIENIEEEEEINLNGAIDGITKKI